MEAQVLALDLESDRPEEFDQLFRRYERQVFLTSLRLLGNREDARDAAQEVFFRLYKHIGRLDRARDPGPWLYRITVNVCRDVARKRQGGEPLPELAVSGEAHAELARGEQRRLVAEGLRRLPAKERAALVLRDIEGLSTAEVARILESAEGTVRSQVSRARVRIREWLKGRL